MNRTVLSWLLIAMALLAIAGMRFYFDNIVIPSQQADAAANNKPRGNLSDLYPRWYGTRELLLRHRDPYGPEVSTEIQRGYWGRELDPNNPVDPKDENRFAYPLYIAFLLAPTITLPFEFVQTLYMWIAALCTVASVWMWLYAFGHRPSASTIIVAGLLLLGSYPVMQALHLQQPALIVAALLAAAVAAVTRGAYWLSGIALGFAMIKPQTALPIVAWLMLWAVSSWKERKSVVFAFGVVMAALLAGSELLLPHWLWEWRDATAAYMRYTGSAVPAHVQLLYGAYAGGAIRVLLIVAAAVFCWIARGDPPSSDRFKLAPPLLLAVSLAVSPIWHEYDLMFLLPAVLLAFLWRRDVVRLRAILLAILGLSAIGLGWQWLAAVGLSAISFTSPQLARSLQILPWLSVFFGPTLGLALLGLVGYAHWRRGP